MTPAEKLALWIRGNLPGGGGPITHLKLQKLVFYAYGAAVALDVEHDIGEIAFDAWEHGPVNRSVWRTYRQYGSAEIPPLELRDAPNYFFETEQVLHDALTVYGSLDAWTLRQQSHLEQPWATAFERKSPIEPRAIREHFARKLRGPEVKAPEYLSHSWNLRIDRLPDASFSSLRELAEAVDRSRS